MQYLRPAVSVAKWMVITTKTLNRKFMSIFFIVTKQLKKSSTPFVIYVISNFYSAEW